MNTLLGFPEESVATAFGTLLRRWRTARGLEPVRRALQFTLRQQEPFPALVVDGQWNIVMGNKGSRIFDLFTDPGDCDEGDQDVNVMRLVFRPDRLRRFIVNWEELAECLVHSLHRQVADTGSAEMRLRDELLAYPGAVFLLDDHHARHAARRHAAAARDRVLLPGRRGHRAAGARPGHGLTEARRRLTSLPLS